MKRSQMKTLLLIEGAVCLTLTLALRLIEGAAFSFAAFPGSAAGQGLSMLAGTGRFGIALFYNFVPYLCQCRNVINIITSYGHVFHFCHFGYFSIIKLLYK